MAESSGFPALDPRRGGSKKAAISRRPATGSPVGTAFLQPIQFRDPSGTGTGNPMPPHSRPYDNVLETIGWTPLIRLKRVAAGIRTPVYAKAEFFNPGGSVKDRIGIAMIEAAEREGRLKPGGLIGRGDVGQHRGRARASRRR